ncbi:MAG: hypothetical protein V2A62_05205 [Candidatus Woesearchaeota archaeon]
MKYAWVLLLIVSLWLVSCTQTNLDNVPENKLCQKDSDCVSAACCHAKEAVNSQNAPNCKGMMCTMECVPETLDCSQGEIKCLKKECTVILK